MTTIHSLSLPIPTEQEQARSLVLIALIKDKIQQSGGAISFAEYMDYALYAPELGYYTNGQSPFGRSGDFVTAPEISPLFSACLARQCGQLLVPPFGKGGLGGILEIGAGSGKMAADMLLAFDAQGHVPHYAILEKSKPLREAQRAFIAHQAPHLVQYVTWLASWPDTWMGVIVANEWLDALPVHRFVVKKDKILEQAVGWENEKFCWMETESLVFPLGDKKIQLPDGFCSEFSQAVPAAIHTIANILQKGAVLLIDYGYLEHEYYHPARSQGTLMCHYKHLAHNDPFVYPGLQDITAHVNFTQVATSAAEAGLEIAGFAHQAAFLMGCGLPVLFETLYAQATPQKQVQLSQQAKWLTMPGEMGERFWVMGFSKQYSEDWMGFEG